MLLRPTAITLVVLFLWYQLNWLHGVSFGEKGIDPIAITEVILVIPFGLLATTVVTKVWENNNKIVDALFTRDDAKFLRYRDERIRVGIHIILIALASAIIGLAAMIPFEEMWEGLMVMTVVTFTHALIWEVIRLLEDPRQSHWIIERTPEEWLKTDLDKRFWPKEEV